jgi:hypothetical protein
MTEIINRLPVELANMIYSYVGMHPVAQLIEDYLKEDADEMEWCEECGLVHFSNRSVNEMYDGLCEYCYAERLGVIVYKCDDCTQKCYEYGRFENTEEGLFCEACYMGYLERQEDDAEE